jgi:hydrogenase-4 component F
VSANWILIVPAAAALLCALPLRAPAGAGITLASSLAVLALTLGVAAQAEAGRIVVGLPGWIEADGLSALMLLVTAAVGTLAALYSWGYMAHTPARPWAVRGYYANFNLFLLSMLAVPLIVEPNVVWTAVELTTLLSVMLVAFENTREAVEAAWKYVVLTIMGASIALLGILVLYWAMKEAGGSEFTWAGLRAVAPQMAPGRAELAFVLILVGFGAKVGLVPLHTWLPDAHSQAPSPVCALLSGVETSSVLYVILRLLPILRAVPGQRLEGWALAVGLISMAVAVFLLFRVRDYKRLFAISTVEHMGLILAAAGLGSSAAHFGLVWQVVTHALAKSFCFYAAGLALMATGTREISAGRGLIRTSAPAGSALLLGGLAIAGAPPFAVFLSEFTIFRAGLAEGHYLATGLLIALIALAFFAIMAPINRMVFGMPEGDASPGHRLPRTCLAAAALGAALVIVLGMYVPAPLHTLLRLAADVLGA